MHVIVTVTIGVVYRIHISRNATFNPACTSSSTQTVVRLGLASVPAYPMADPRRVNFRVDGSLSWYTVADIGQRNLFGVANLKINLTTNALFLADGGEVARVATTISSSSWLRT